MSLYMRVKTGEI